MLINVTGKKIALNPVLPSWTSHINTQLPCGRATQVPPKHFQSKTVFFLDYSTVNDTTVLLDIRVSLSFRVKKPRWVFCLLRERKSESK